MTADTVSVQEAAQLLGISPATVGQYASVGRLQRTPEGITRRSVERWMERQATARQRQELPRLAPRRWAVDG